MRILFYKRATATRTFLQSTFKNVPKLNTGKLHVTDKGGFKGELSEFKYFNKALSPNEIYWIYRKGYQTFSLYDKIAKIKPKIKLNVSVGASVNDNEVSASGGIG